MERTLWTDERVSDAISRIDQRFDAIERRFDTIDRRLDSLSTELREIRSELLALNRQFGRVGWALAGAMFIQLVAIILTRSGA
jgi:chromosome segregation ATPase